MIVLEFFPIFGFHAWKFINYNSFPKGSVVGAFHTCVYVVANFLSQVIFVFLLFLGMVMYANEI